VPRPARRWEDRYRPGGNLNPEALKTPATLGGSPHNIGWRQTPSHVSFRHEWLRSIATNLSRSLSIRAGVPVCPRYAEILYPKDALVNRKLPTAAISFRTEAEEGGGCAAYPPFLALSKRSTTLRRSWQPPFACRSSSARALSFPPCGQDRETSPARNASPHSSARRADGRS